MTIFDHAIESDWEEGVETICRYPRRGGSFGVVADGSLIKTMPTAGARRIGAGLNRRLLDHPQGANLVAWANVITSPLVRGVVTAIRWMSPAGPFRQTNVALLDEGIRWVRAELDKPR
jgi:hypothetical protein